MTLMKTRLNQNGFTYLLALTLVVIMGIMLGMIGQSWKTVMQREREKELLFRGSQIKEAMENWYNKDYPPPRGHVVMPLNKLDDLLLDPNSLTPIRYLRYPYTDPMAPDKEWPDCWTTGRGAVQKAGVPNKGATPLGINSVASTSTAAAIKVSFSEYSSLSSLGDKKSDPADPDFKDRPLQYRDWQFVADPNSDHSKTYNAYHERW